MKAESHTMTLKTKQHSWPRGVQFFRKHIMSGMWTRAWLSLFCLCFFLFFFYFEIVRVVHRRWTQCQTARLDLCTNILQGKGTFSTSENGGKNRKVFWAYHHNLCLSPIFLSFFTKFEFGRGCQVLTQWRFSMNHKQTQSGQNSISRMTGSSVCIVWLHKETTLKGVDLIGILCK